MQIYDVRLSVAYVCTYVMIGPFVKDLGSHQL